VVLDSSMTVVSGKKTGDATESDLGDVMVVSRSVVGWVCARCRCVTEVDGGWKPGSMVDGGWTVDVYDGCGFDYGRPGFFLDGLKNKQSNLSQSINVKGARAHRTLND
jgi:hypothetical protein